MLCQMGYIRLSFLEIKHLNSNVYTAVELESP